VAADVTASLRLFALAPADRPCALLLDRAGDVRARWPAERIDGLADPARLAADAERVAHFPAAAPNHAGHTD
jgi:hypothetical protein